MRSIGARLAVWYALAATVTFAALSVAGYFLLEEHMIHGLDLLNASEFKQLQARLEPGHAGLDAPELETRIRETSDQASVLFYIDIHKRGAGTLFRSTNLRGKSIPDIKGLREFNVVVPGIGELRAGEFLLDPLEVMVATPLRPVRNVMEGYVEVCAALIAVMLAVSAAIGFGLSYLALQPMRMIQQTAIRISSKNLSERIPVADVSDEVSSLARLLNKMFDGLESAFNQVRRFTADASHELKTPLTIMRLQAEKLIFDGHLTTAQEEVVQSQLEEIARLNAIIEELLFLSRAEAHAISMDRKAYDPHAFLQSFAQDARVLAEHGGVQFRDSHEGDGVAVFDPKWLRQVLLNLLSNALKASPAGGRVALQSVLSGWTWRVSIEDEGPGVPDNMRAHIFDRFVRLDPATDLQSGGTGLGLAICRGIVDLHQGRIFAESGSEGKGLRVVFELPAQGAHLPSEFRID